METAISKSFCDNCTILISGRCSRHVSIADRKEWFGVSWIEGSTRFVFGLVRRTRSHSVMALRSYVWPSTVHTGSVITSCVIGQTNDSGIGSCSGDNMAA